MKCVLWFQLLLRKTVFKVPGDFLIFGKEGDHHSCNLRFLKRLPNTSLPCLTRLCLQWCVVFVCLPKSPWLQAGSLADATVPWTSMVLSVLDTEPGVKREMRKTQVFLPAWLPNFTYYLALLTLKEAYISTWGAERVSEGRVV